MDAEEYLYFSKSLGTEKCEFSVRSGAAGMKVIGPLVMIER